MAVGFKYTYDALVTIADLANNMAGLGYLSALLRIIDDVVPATPY